MKKSLLSLALCLVSFTVSAFDLQGHRGVRGLAPENTLASFELAMALGVTTLETDAAITRDGVIVLHHDLAFSPNITRDAQGRWLDQPSAPIHHMDWEQVRDFDVGRIKPGTRYASDFADQKPIDGTRVPRLAELFDLVKRSGNTSIRFAIETKINPNLPEATQAPEPYATALVKAIREAGMAQRVQIMSFDWRSLQVVQRIAPEIATVYLTAQQSWLDNIGAGKPQDSLWTAGVEWSKHGSVPKMIKAAGGAIWSVHFRDIDADKVKEAKALGIAVLVWTVNDAPTMHRMLDLGVDGLITDRADIAGPVLKARGIKPS